MRILFVTEISSIHAARWINQLNDTDWAIHVFQAIPPVNRTNSELNTGYLYCPYPLNSKYYFIKDLFRLLNNHVNDAYYHFPDHVNNWYFKKLSSLIKKLQPDIIHSLGFNINWRNYCLPVLQAKKSQRKIFRLLGSIRVGVRIWIIMPDAQPRRKTRSLLFSVHVISTFQNASVIIIWQRSMVFPGNFWDIFPHLAELILISSTAGCRMRIRRNGE